MNEKFCPVCKNKNASDAANCAYCGVPFGPSGQGPITTVPMQNVQPELILKRGEHLQYLAEYPRDALIFYVMGTDQPLVVPGFRPVMLGRSTTSVMPDLVDLSPYGAADLGVSRQHAQINYSDTYTIVDVGSTNGTWLNEARLTAHKPYPLHSGDEVRLGSLRLMIYYRQNETSGTSTEEVISLAEAPSASAQRPRLTVAYLTAVIQPYLAALAVLQKVIDEFQGLQPGDIYINTIGAMRPELPVGISLTGAAQAVLLVKTFVAAWRSENAADLSLYLTGRLPAAAGESSPTAADLHPSAATVLLVTEASQGARQAALEALRARLPQLAQRAAEHLAVQRAADQTTLADRLLPPLSVVATSRLQMVLDQLKTGD